MKIVQTRNDISVLANIIYRHREWHASLQRRFDMHPAVLTALTVAPSNWTRVVLQWPHRSQDDPKQLAYTRNLIHAHQDRQTRTAVGKYIREHFPTLRDDEIRDLVYEHLPATNDGFQLVATVEQIVKAVQEGPSSCMQWDDYEVQKNSGHHPYECYDPRFGWSLAQRTNPDGAIVSRALVHTSASGSKTYVRAYGNGDEDRELIAWMKGQGIAHRHYWPEGAKLARILVQGCSLFPYIDGNVQNVDVSNEYLRITEDGEYNCTNTDGTAEENDRHECPDCGNSVCEDDRTWVGVNGDDWACQRCIEDNYRYVEGRNGNQYYVHVNSSIEIDEEWYDEHRLPSPAVDTVNHGMQFNENCVEIDGDWYREDDDAVVVLHNGDYALRGDAWRCEASYRWYLTAEVDPVEIDGDTFHPDSNEAREHMAASDDADDYDKPEGSIPNEAQVEMNLHPCPNCGYSVRLAPGLTVVIQQAKEAF